MDFDYATQQEVALENRTGAKMATSVVGCNTSREHGLFICKLNELDGKDHVLLSSINELISHTGFEFDLSVRRYANWNHSEGLWYVKDVSNYPVYGITYSAGPFELIKELIFVEKQNTLFVRYTLKEFSGTLKMRIKPLTAFRRFDKLSKKNNMVDSQFRKVPNGVAIKMYPSYPELFMQTSWAVKYIHTNDWCNNLEYTKESNLYSEHCEDLYMPGYFEVEMQANDQFLFSVSLHEMDIEYMPMMFISEMAKTKTMDNRITKELKEIYRTKKRMSPEYILTKKEFARDFSF